MNKMTFKAIEKEADKLPSEKKLKLVESLIHKLRLTAGKTTLNKPLDWAKLYGLGKGVWTGLDAQSYVNKLRENR